MVLPGEQRAQLASIIDQNKHKLASYATDRIYKTAYWSLRYGEQGRVTCFNDNLKNIDVFSLTIRNGSPMMTDTHVLWLRDLYIKLGMCTVFLRQSFQYMQEAAQNLAAQNLIEGPAAQAFIDVLESAKGGLGYSDPLYDELLQHQDGIVELVTHNMYQSSPYWRVRYGERGRSSCMVDTYYNIAYVADAIGANTQQGILIHTQWMRDFLISRGMCSRYYLEAWQELFDAMTQMLSPQQHQRVRAIYEAVRANLTYEHPFAQAISLQEAAIISHVTQLHYDRDAQLQARLSRQEYAQDITYKLSYLVDAVVHDKPNIFADYINWMREAALELGVTGADINASVQAISQSLPQDAPPNVQDLLRVQQSVAGNPHTQVMQSRTHAIGQDIERALHHPNAFWTHITPAEDQPTRRQAVHGAVAQAAQGFNVDSLRPVLAWVQAQAQPFGASRAYLLAFTQALRQSARQHVPAHTAQEFDTRLIRGLEALTDDDPALALLQIPDLVAPIIQNLRGYSPYWQVDYQRRSQAAITQDVFALIGFLADDLMELTDVGFPTAADQQRHYLLKQGICTAYYQQVLDLTLDVLQSVVDAETLEKATIVLDAANAILESDNETVLAVAQQQDAIVSFVIHHLQQAHPDWVVNYPGGWQDATTDMYYWLAYLSDALTFNNPGMLAAHIGWLHDYAHSQNRPPAYVRTTLIALGHALKMHVPQQANQLLHIMSTALARLNQ